MGVSSMGRILIGAVIGATGIALAAPLSNTGVGAAATTTTVYASAATGISTPSHATPVAAGQTTLHARRGVRSAPRSNSGPSPAAGVSTASAAVTPVTSSVLHNFNGVSSNDSRITNFNLEFEPPDQGLCVGNGYVLEAVNSAFRIYTSSGKTIVGPSNVNDLFNVGSLEFTSDPRCYFDASTNTWFATILFISADSKSSQLLIAVNSSGNPQNVWSQYQIDTTHAGGRGCPCFGDQPTLGIDQNNLYVTTNEFSILGPQFNGAQIYAFSKQDLIAGVPIHFAHFSHLTIGGAVAASVQPAISTGGPSAEFFLNALDPTGTTDHRLGVWAMTNRTALQHGQSPTLSSTVITSEAYGLPPAAAQRGSNSTLDFGDDRMQQTQYINGMIWGELTTVVTIPHDSTPRAGAAWFSVRPSLSGTRIGGAVIAHQGYVVQAGSDVIYPALQSLPSGNAAMVFTVTGHGLFPSAAYAALGAGQSSFGPITIVASGTGPYNKTSTRWGDYSWAVIDPAAQGVWLATEYMPPLSSQTPDGQQNWGTRVVEVAVG